MWTPVVDVQVAMPVDPAAAAAADALEHAVWDTKAVFGEASGIALLAADCGSAGAKGMPVLLRTGLAKLTPLYAAWSAIRSGVAALKALPLAVAAAATP